jgi:hypothetical protein
MTENQAIPFGNVPAGNEMDSLSGIPDSLFNALRHAMKNSGGRYGIAVFTHDENCNEVLLNFNYGPAWSGKCFLTAYGLFVGEFLKVTPGLINAINRTTEAAQSPQASFGPAPPAEIPPL